MKFIRRKRSRKKLTIFFLGIVFLILSLFVILSSQKQTLKEYAATGEVTTSTGVVTHGAITTTSNTIGWLIECTPSHTLPDDPIVHPGQPGAAHLHDFWGNASTNANSTLQTQEANSNYAVADTYNGSTVQAGTSCDLSQFAPGTAGETASYWAPVLYANGQPVTPVTKAELYYRAKPTFGTEFKPIPQDARILVGNHFATSIATNDALVNGQLYWECDGNTSTHYQLPPTTCTSMLMNVVFPSCYDNGPMDHTGPHGSDNPHFAYAVNGVCPANFPQKVPQLSEKFKYTVPATGMLLQLSADPGMGLMPGYTAHADFWNTWNPASLQYLVDNCINAQISCGTNPIVPFSASISVTSTPSPTPAYLPADINHSGCINIIDFNLWLQAYQGHPVAGTFSDINGDGVINILDYNSWLTTLQSMYTSNPNDPRLCTN